MAIPHDSLPSNVLDAIRGGNKVEAIKRLRQATGLGLAEAKARIEAHEHGKSGKPTTVAQFLSGEKHGHGGSGRPASVAEFLAGEMPAQLKAAIERGNFVEAIKLVRDHQGIGLKEAKAAVERARPDYVANPDAPPDTFHRIVTALWWILALGLAGVVAYYFLVGD